MGDEDDVVLWLPVLPESVGIARHRVRRFGRLAPEADSVVGLLVTELVGAAIQALPATPARQIELRLGRLPSGGLRATVSALGLSMHAVEHGGLGSLILERLSDDWGQAEDGLWFELHAHKPASAARGHAAAG